MRRSELEHITRNLPTELMLRLERAPHFMNYTVTCTGRYKDLDFIQALIQHEMIQEKIMLTRLAETELQKAERSRIVSKIEAMFSN